MKAAGKQQLSFLFLIAMTVVSCFRPGSVLRRRLVRSASPKACQGMRYMSRTNDPESDSDNMDNPDAQMPKTFPFRGMEMLGEVVNRAERTLTSQNTGSYDGNDSGPETNLRSPTVAAQDLLAATTDRAKRTLSTNAASSQSSTGSATKSRTTSGMDNPDAQMQRNYPFRGMEMLGEAKRQAKSTSSSGTNAGFYRGLDLESGSGAKTSPQSPLSLTATGDLLSTAADQAKRSLSTNTPQSTDQDVLNDESKERDDTFQTTDLRYGQNPAISFTALAQWLWASVLRPHQDSVIDATCGNGYDSAGIASLLFSNEDLYLEKTAELVCVDVQKEACTATEEALSKIVNSWTLANQIQIVQGSHAPLPLPKNTSSVGLVVYNLGYLPNAKEKEQFQTQVDTTISSVMDALLLIRVGGMVSVMTYPRTNQEEDFAVRALLEAAVLMTNKRGQKWYNFVDELGCNADVKALLTKELRRMSSHYDQKDNVKRTFRVSEHKKIGLAQAPVLVTATRIK